MAVQTLERGIMARRQNAPAPKPVMASEARAQLESSVIAATLSGMNRDAHLLGDVLDICPAGCFVTPEAAPLAVALDLLRQSGQRPNLTALATQMQSRWAKDPERWPAPDMARMAELSTSAWGLKGHAESLARKLADEHRRAELHAGLLEIAAEASVYGVDSEYIADRARKLVEASGGIQEAVTMSNLMERIRAKLDNPQSLRKVQQRFAWGIHAGGIDRPCRSSRTWKDGFSRKCGVGCRMARNGCALCLMRDERRKPWASSHLPRRAYRRTVFP